MATGFKIPKTDAAAADLLGTTRESRLELEKQVAVLKAQETALREYLVLKLPRNDATGIAGQDWRVQREMTPEPTVEDWDKLWAHIKKTGDFDLLHKRLGAEAVRERWMAKKKVPGVGVFNRVWLSLSKVA